MGLYTPFVKYAVAFRDRSRRELGHTGPAGPRSASGRRFVCPSCGDEGWLATECPRCERAFVELRPDGLPGPLVEEHLVRASHRLSPRRVTPPAPRLRMRMADAKRRRRRRRLLRRAGAPILVTSAVGRREKEPVRIDGQLQVLDAVTPPQGEDPCAGYVLYALYDTPCDCDDEGCTQTRRWSRRESRLGRLAVVDPHHGVALLDTRGMDWDVAPADARRPREPGTLLWTLEPGDRVQVVGRPHAADALAASALGGYRGAGAVASVVLRASPAWPLTVIAS